MVEIVLWKDHSEAFKKMKKEDNEFGPKIREIKSRGIQEEEKKELIKKSSKILLI